MFGFADNDIIYCAIATKEILPFVLNLDHASRGCGYSLRFKPTKAQKEILKTCEIFAVCSAKYFEEEFNSMKYNRGEVFEKIITERFGQKWEKDQVPFTKAGDIEINGKPYQIKFEKATFISERGLQNFKRSL
jgi:hypothetical protein